MLQRAAELVTVDGDAIDLAFVQSIRLGLEQEQGNLLEALAIAEAPLVGFPEPPDQAAAIRDSSIASCLATLGRPAQALQMLAGARTYVRAGASRDTARVRAALRQLGVRKRQVSVGRPDHGWESLTKSERLVVDLVAQGLTNREAASELFLSPDTINAHLRHAFAKLNIRSRVQLARIAAERERAPA